MNALHYAAYFDVPDLVRVLLKGARPEVREGGQAEAGRAQRERKEGLEARGGCSGVGSEEGVGR